jgi:hypothetical protein
MPVTVPSARSAVHRLIASRPTGRRCFHITGSITRTLLDVRRVSQTHRPQSPSLPLARRLLQRRLCESWLKLPRTCRPVPTPIARRGFVPTRSSCRSRFAHPALLSRVAALSFVSSDSPEAGPEVSQPFPIRRAPVYPWSPCRASARLLSRRFSNRLGVRFASRCRHDFFSPPRRNSRPARLAVGLEGRLHALRFGFRLATGLRLSPARRRVSATVRLAATSNRF